MKLTPPSLLSPTTLVQGQMQANNSSSPVPFCPKYNMLAFSHHTVFLTFMWSEPGGFPLGLAVLLSTRGLTFQLSCITFPLCGVRPQVSMCAHGGVCAMHDLFGQCILRSGSECPSSHCVGVHVSLYCISVFFFVLIDLPMKTFSCSSLLLFSSMLCSCLPLSRWGRAFNSTFLWCTRSLVASLEQLHLVR